VARLGRETPKWANRRYGRRTLYIPEVNRMEYIFGDGDFEGFGVVCGGLRIEYNEGANTAPRALRSCMVLTFDDVPIEFVDNVFVFFVDKEPGLVLYP
jgi:hypothetical protein